MRAVRIYSWILALALTLAGCGAPTTALRYGVAPDGSEMRQVEAIDKSGVLNTLDLNLLDEGSFQILAEGDKPVTRFGVIRSREDGKFFLQVKRGLFDKYLGYPEWNIPLEGTSEAKTLKLASHLNRLVILRGIMQGETLEVRLLMSVPSLGYVTDLITKGRVTGTVYDERTKEPLKDGAMTLKASNNGNLFRSVSKQNGKYGFFRIPAGRYTLKVVKAGYVVYQTELNVIGARNCQTLVPLQANGEPKTPEPVVKPSPAPSVAPSVAPTEPTEPSVAPSSNPSNPSTPSPAPTCPLNPIVWVNTESGVYHYSSSIWYGTTKQGAFMTEAEAKAKGYRASKLS